MRPSFDEMWIEISQIIRKRSTCPRMQVGCVLTDEDNRVLSTGYNGVVSGEPHCLGLTDPCACIHAEANAVAWCREPNKVHTCYVTHEPCLNCRKLLSSIRCTRIIVGNLK